MMNEIYVDPKFVEITADVLIIIYKKLYAFSCLQRAKIRMMTSGWQKERRISGHMRHGRELVSKPAISLKKVGWASVERIRVSVISLRVRMRAGTGCANERL